MTPRTALTTALVAALVPAMVLTCIIIAGASPIAAAIAAFGLGVAVHNAFNIWRTHAPTKGRRPRNRQRDTGQIPYNGS